MKDNMKNFKEISDLVLKDIYASDELKRKTLERCTAKKQPKFNPAILSTASAAVLLIAFGITSHYINHPMVATNSHVNDQIRNEYKNPPAAGNSDSSKMIAEIVPAQKNSSIKNDFNISADKPAEPVTNTQNNTNTDVQVFNTTAAVDDTAPAADTAPEEENDMSQNVSASLSKEFAVTFRLKPLSLADAENNFGSKILLPQYVPEGFTLKSISIPDNESNCIKLRYSIRTAYFEILQSKNLSEFKGDKTISLGNNKAAVNYSKDDNSNKITTITWTTNSIQYTLSGDLPENILINIAKYLN